MDENQKSLLDVLNERFEALNGSKDILSRVVYVGRIKSSATADTVMEIHRKIVGETHQDIVTGLGLAMKDVFVHLLECTEDTTMAIIKAVHEKDILEDVKVFIAISDCRSRCFETWVCHALVRDGDGALEGTDDEINLTVFEMYSKLAKIGSERKPLQRKQAITVKEIKQSFFDLVPSYNRLYAITKMDHFPTVEEYIDLFDSPIHIQLESERVWPVSRLINY